MRTAYLPLIIAACTLGQTSAVAWAPERVIDVNAYVATFNAGDLGFVNYYSPDVVFDKGPEDGKLIGRQAIAAWYASIWRDFDETVTPLTIAIDSGGEVMMIELRVELEARRDGVTWRERTYRKGDRLIVDGTIVYTLRDGLITSIRGAAEGRTVIAAGDAEP